MALCVSQQYRHYICRNALYHGIIVVSDSAESTFSVSFEMCVWYHLLVIAHYTRYTAPRFFVDTGLVSEAWEHNDRSTRANDTHMMLDRGTGVGSR